MPSRVAVSFVAAAWSSNWTVLLLGIDPQVLFRDVRRESLDFLVLTFKELRSRLDREIHLFSFRHSESISNHILGWLYCYIGFITSNVETIASQNPDKFSKSKGAKHFAKQAVQKSPREIFRAVRKIRSMRRKPDDWVTRKSF